MYFMQKQKLNTIKVQLILCRFINIISPSLSNKIKKSVARRSLETFINIEKKITSEI